ncbi:MAG: C-GCAxxG-C-C family protein [Oscillospiraceae bacterium]|nr:C-GCAxxG-C-C family protein [Oscillospiraceae bacterium]MCD8099315.1 C-GCAxxG-C-C family protein [Oscillospiraceae bacterium]
MTKEEKIEKAVSAAVEAQIRDDICARSAMYGLKQVFDFIPEELVTASLSLAGGCGAGSGSCGAYCAGLLAVGMKYNSTMEEEKTEPELIERGCEKFVEFRDRFLAAMGTIMCPELHEKVFGRRYVFTDPVQHEEFGNLPGHAEKCAEVVAAAVRVTCEMLLEDE